MRPRSASAISTSERNILAEERTALAEHLPCLTSARTLSARSLAAAIGSGLGSNALFKMVETTWVPKAIANDFDALAFFIIVAAERRAPALASRVTGQEVTELGGINPKKIVIAIATGELSPDSRVVGF